MNAKTTIERIAVLEEKVDQVGKNVCDLKSDFKAFIDSADRKYASKERLSRVERIVFGAVGFILTAVLYLILKSAGI
jgi:t-SNARE complex subunit (syntaxin)